MDLQALLKGTWEISAAGPQGVPHRRHAQDDVQVIRTLVHEVYKTFLGRPWLRILHTCCHNSSLGD